MDRAGSRRSRAGGRPSRSLRAACIGQASGFVALAPFGIVGLAPPRHVLDVEECLALEQGRGARPAAAPDAGNVPALRVRARSVDQPSRLACNAVADTRDSHPVLAEMITVESPGPPDWRSPTRHAAQSIQPGGAGSRQDARRVAESRHNHEPVAASWLAAEDEVGMGGRRIAIPRHGCERRGQGRGALRPMDVRRHLVAVDAGDRLRARRRSRASVYLCSPCRRPSEPGLGIRRCSRISSSELAAVTSDGGAAAPPRPGQSRRRPPIAPRSSRSPDSGCRGDPAARWRRHLDGIALRARLRQRGRPRGTGALGCVATPERPTSTSSSRRARSATAGPVHLRLLTAISCRTAG